MTFRTVVRDGLIVVNTHGAVPDGTPMEVVRATPARKARKKPVSAPRRPKSKAKPLKDLPAFGMWKNRPEWKGMSTLQILAELRKKALGQRPRG